MSGNMATERCMGIRNPINATLLAKYIINRTNTNGRYITHLQLQKILYYVQGYFAAFFDRHLFGEDIEAWYYGPVVRQVYEEYFCNGAAPLYSMLDNDNEIIYFSDDERQIVNKVIDIKSAMSARELVNATHKEDPWKAYEARVQSKPVIPFETIKEYFKKVVKDSHEQIS